MHMKSVQTDIQMYLDAQELTKQISKCVLMTKNWPTKIQIYWTQEKNTITNWNDIWWIVSSNIQIFEIDAITDFGRQKKLDQETWLYRTHLDDF